MPRESSSSRTRRRPSSRGQQRSTRPSEKYSLLLSNVPSVYEWQDVKDHVREFAPQHTRGTQDFGDSLPGVFEVIITDRDEAKNAYRHLVAKGFMGRAQIKVVLKKHEGSKLLDVLGAEISPPVPHRTRTHSQCPPSNQPPMAPVRAFTPQYARPVMQQYPTTARHGPAPASAPANINDLTRGMQAANLNDASRHRRPDNLQPARPARHALASSTTSRVSPSNPTLRRSSPSRRDGPLVIDGSRSSFYDSD